MDLLTVGLGGAILTYVWRIQDLYPILRSMRLPIVMSLLAWGLYLLDSDPRRALRTTFRSRITRLTAAILVLSICSVPTSLWQGLSFHFIVDDYGKNFILMLLLAASVRAFADVERYALFLVVGSMMYASYVILNVHIESNGRLGNIVYYDANDLGMLLVSTLPLALYFLLRGKSLLYKAGAFLALALQAVVVVRTGSRGAFLGLIGVGVFLLLRFDAVAVSKRLAAVAAVAATLVVLGGGNYWELMSTLLHPQNDYNWAGQSETGRVEVWKRGMGYMFGHPLLGVGVAAFPIAEGHISPLAIRQQYGRGLKWSAAHNMFVQIGAELGILGLILLAVLIWTSYRSALLTAEFFPRRERAPPDQKVLGQALAASVVGYLVAGFFLSQAFAAFAYTLYGLLIGFEKLRPTASPSVMVARRALRWQGASLPASSAPVAAGGPVPSWPARPRA